MFFLTPAEPKKTEKSKENVFRHCSIKDFAALNTKKGEELRPPCLSVSVHSEGFVLPCKATPIFQIFTLVLDNGGSLFCSISVIKFHSSECLKKLNKRTVGTYWACLEHSYHLVKMNIWGKTVFTRQLLTF